MTIAALLAAQAALHAQIQARSIELGHDSAKVEPIYDGVFNAEEYLASAPKVMWILKEPYDDFDAEGMPAAGGWTMFKDFGDGDTLAKAVNRNAALRNVTYASCAIQNNIGTYAELPWITDNPEAYEKAIRRITYCNIGKIPGMTTTSDAHLADLYRDWKDILFRQIDLYAPDVIIVCGTATLQCMNRDLGPDLSQPARTIRRGGAVVDVDRWRARRVPHRRIRGTQKWRRRKRIRPSLDRLFPSSSPGRKRSWNLYTPARSMRASSRPSSGILESGSADCQSRITGR